MAKKIKFESFVYRFLAELERLERSLDAAMANRAHVLAQCIAFSYAGGSVTAVWSAPIPGQASFDVRAARLYVRHDRPGRESERHALSSALEAGDGDPVMHANHDFFRTAVESVFRQACGGPGDGPPAISDALSRRLAEEESFHDQWAAAESIDDIDVITANEACTAPEMRCIVGQLGDLRGRKLLDVGCGLGEASVYFALKGARVTATDLSQGMLDATRRLGLRHGVEIATHKAASESLLLDDAQKFDVIYCGNLLHHVDIAATLRLVKPHLAPGGRFVSWDPLAYNPAINVYRRMATDVRTPDEHPLRRRDIELFRAQFRKVSLRFFWLTTLLIFVLMVLAQRRDPNQERLWKSVVREGDRWAPLYKPLAFVDRMLVRLPGIRWLSWNVVIVASDPITDLKP